MVDELSVVRVDAHDLVVVGAGIELGVVVEGVEGELVEELHGFDEAQSLGAFDDVADFDEVRFADGGADTGPPRRRRTWRP